MKRHLILRAAVLGLALLAGCGLPDAGTPDCRPGYEDLRSWTANPQGLADIAIDPACPSSATFHISEAVPAAYLERIQPREPGQLITLQADFTTACPPGDGIVQIGINEGGAGVAAMTMPLGAQSLRTSWIAKTDTVGLIVRVQAGHRCDVGALVVVGR